MVVFFRIPIGLAGGKQLPEIRGLGENHFANSAGLGHGNCGKDLAFLGGRVNEAVGRVHGEDDQVTALTLCFQFTGSLVHSEDRVVISTQVGKLVILGEEALGLTLDPLRLAVVVAVLLVDAGHALVANVHID